MTHAEIERDEVVELYVLRRLSAREEAEFEEHYLDCEDCREKVRQDEPLVEMLRSACADWTYAPRRPRRWFLPAPAWGLAAAAGASEDPGRADGGAAIAGGGVERLPGGRRNPTASQPQRTLRSATGYPRPNGRLRVCPGDCGRVRHPGLDQPQRSLRGDAGRGPCNPRSRAWPLLGPPLAERHAGPRIPVTS